MVSVIIPVYQVEQYIRQCIKSIVNQTYSDIEIIIVNDGTRDKSIEICKEYQIKDKRIKIINKKNGGLMSAWLEGLKYASADWVFFVDSDDWVDNDAIEKLIKHVDDNIDIICANYILEHPTGGVPDSHTIEAGTYIKHEIENSIIPRLISNKGYLDRGIRVCRWAKLIRKDLLLENIKYCNTKLTIGEDMNIMVPLIVKAQGIKILEENYIYHYRMNPESIMKRMSPTMWTQVELLYVTMRDIIRDLKSANLEQQLQMDFVDLTIMTLERELQQLSLKTDNWRSFMKSENKQIVYEHLNVNRYTGSKRYVVTLIAGYSNLKYIRTKALCVLRNTIRQIKMKIKRLGK